jgi:hypothetical protein
MTQILYRPHHSARNIRDLLPPGETDWTNTNPNPMETAGDSSNFGKALSSYEDYLVVGEPNNGVGGDFGAFTLYSTPDNGDSWIKIAKIFPPVGYSDGVKDFGTAVSIYGDYILIGSPGDTINGVANAGSVYAYTFNPSTKAITFQERILQNTTVEASYFGREVDHHGNNAVIACDNGLQATSTKIAYAYKTINHGVTWQLKSNLIPTNAVGALKFGYELFIFGDWITLAAYAENNNVGRVYIYRTYDSGDSWIRTQIIDAVAQVADTYFGFAMAMNEILLVLGAPGANAGKGTVYVYGQEVSGLNITWVLRSTIQPPAGNVTEFATTVSLQDGVLLVGAPGTQNEFSTGAIYLYLDDDEAQPGTYLETPITIPAPNGVDDDFGSTIIVNDGSISVGGGGGTVYTYPAPSTPPRFPTFPRNYTPVESEPIVVSRFGYPAPVIVPQIVPRRVVIHRDYVVAPSPGGGTVIVHHVGGGSTTTLSYPPRPGRVVERVTVYHSPRTSYVYVGGGSPATNEVIFYRAPSPTVEYFPPIIVTPPVTSVQGVPVFNFGIELVLDGNTLTVMDGNGNVFTYTTDDDGNSWDYIGALNIPGVSGASEMVRFGDTLVVTQPDATRYGVAGSGMLQIYVTFDGGKNWVLTTVNYPTDSTLDFGRTFKEDHNLLAVSARRLRLAGSTDGTRSLDVGYEGVVYIYELNRTTLIWNQISVIVDPIAAEHLESFGSVLDFTNNTITITVPERAVSFGTSTVYVYQTTNSGHTWSMLRTLEAPSGTEYAAVAESGLLIGGTAGIQGSPDTSSTMSVLPANSGVTSVYLNEVYVPDAGNYSTPIKVLLGGATSGYVLIEYATVELLTAVPGGVGDIFSIADQNGNLLESVPLSLRYESYGYGCVVVPITASTGFLTITPTSSSYWRATCFSPAQWACPWLINPVKGIHASEVNAVGQDSMSPSCARRISPQTMGDVATTQTVLTDSAFNVTKTYPYTYTFTLTASTAVVFSVRQGQQYPAAGSLSMFASDGTTQLTTTYWGGNGVYALATTLAAGTYKFKAIATNTIGGSGSAASLLTFRKTFSTSQLAVATEPTWYAVAMLRTKSGSVAFTGICDQTCKVSLYASGSNTPIDVPGGFTSALQTKNVTLTPNTTYFVVALMNTAVGQATYLSLKAVDSGSTIFVTSRDWRVASFSSSTLAAAGVTPIERTALIFENSTECTAYMQRYDATVGALLLSRSNMYLYTGTASGWNSTGTITVANGPFVPFSFYTNPITGNRYYVDTSTMQFLGTTPVPYSPAIADATVATLSVNNAATYNTEIGRNPTGTNLAAIAAPMATAYNTEIGRNLSGTNLSAIVVSNAAAYNTEIGRNLSGTNLSAIVVSNAAAYNTEIGRNLSGTNLAEITAGLMAAYTYAAPPDYVAPLLPSDLGDFVARSFPSYDMWYAVAYGNNKFVAVCAGGTDRAATSLDGITWVLRTLPVSAVWMSVVYCNSLFIAVNNNTDKILTSPDGILWATRLLPSSGSWRDVAFSNDIGTYVVVATNSNKVATSTDAITWVARTMPSDDYWHSITYGNSLFVAINHHTSATSTNGITWATGTLPSTGDTWEDVIFGAGKFVAVCSNSALAATSPDGVTWTARTLPSIADWESVTYGNGVFTTVAESSNKAAISVDGITWTAKALPSIADWQSVTYGDNKFVTVASDPSNKAAVLSFGVTAIYTTADFVESITAVSKYAYSMVYGNNTFVCLDYIGVSNPGNKAYTSPDGITWTQRALSFSSLWIDVTYGNGMFVAITKSSTNRVSTSLDGITWTTRTLPMTAEWSSIAYGNGTFVVTSSSANKAVVYSANGIDWSASAETVARAWRVAYGAGKFVAVAANASAFMYSPDGLAWYAGTLPSASFWYDIAYGGGLFVAIAYNSNKIATSPDGITWTARTVPVSDYWYRIVYGNGMFVVTGIGPTDTALVSTNGINWTTKALPSDLQYKAVAFGNNKFVAHGYNSNTVEILSPTAQGAATAGELSAFSLSQMPAATYWRSVAYGNGVFVATTENTLNIAATSPDGFTWTQRTLPSAGSWYTVVYGNGMFVAFCNASNKIATSPDGITWTARTLPGSGTWYGAAFGNGLFVALATNTSKAYTSPDGITWATRTLPSVASWTDVTFGNGTFVIVAAGPSNKAATSPDGITWTARTLPVTGYWRAVDYGNGTFVAITQSNSNIAATSPDGITWTQRTLPTSSYWYTVSYGAGVFVAVSNDKAATSTDGITWTDKALPPISNWNSIAYGDNRFVTIAEGTDKVAIALSLA